MFLRIEQWQRPDHGGDFALLLRLPSNGVCLIVGDIAGHGPRAWPHALYVQGFLRGWMAAQAVSPRLEAIVAALSTELRRAAVEAAWFIAILHRWPNGAYVYEAASHRFPAPLLLRGSRPLTSTAEVRSRREAMGPGGISVTLPGRFRLVAATDGLLKRLGAGEEAAGKSLLLRWQRSPARDEALAGRLDTAAPQLDDELCVSVVCEEWLVDLTFEVSNRIERQQAKRRLRAALAPIAGPRGQSWLGVAAAELMKNVWRHAYDGGSGTISIRFYADAGIGYFEVHQDGPRGRTWTARGGLRYVQRIGEVEVRPRQGATVTLLTVKLLDLVNGANE